MHPKGEKLNVVAYITGIAGFLGSNVAEKLVEAGHEVYGCDSLKFGFSENITDPRINWHGGSFFDLQESELEECDVLIHMACDNIIYAQEFPVESFRTNAVESIKLIEKFRKKIVYTSTTSIYGHADIFPTPETAEEKTTNSYSQSKFIVESYLNMRTNFTTLRLSNCYGARHRPENKFCGVVGKFIDCGLRHKLMRAHGDGKATRDYTFVDDVSAAIVKAVEKDATNTEINIGSGIETSVNELVDIITEELHGSRAVMYVPKRGIDNIDRRVLDISKAKRLLGWEPKISLPEGVSRTIKWQKQNKIIYDYCID